MPSTIVAVALSAVVKDFIGFTESSRRGSSLDLVVLARFPWREARDHGREPRENDSTCRKFISRL